MARVAIIYWIFSIIIVAFLLDLNVALGQSIEHSAPNLILPCLWNGSCGSGCVPLIECTSLISNEQTIKVTPCRLNGNGAIGVCCPPRIRLPSFSIQQKQFGQPGSLSFPIPFTARPIFTTTINPPLTNASVLEIKEEIENVSHTITEEVVHDEKFEQDLVEQGLFVHPNSSDALHSMFTQPDSESADSAMDAFISLLILNEIAENLNGTFLKHLGSLIDKLETVNIEENSTIATEISATERSKRIKRLSPSILASLVGNDISLAKLCESALQPNCDVNSKYRTLDGTCNNVENKNWGAALFRFNRWFPNARYDDGISEPRLSVSGEELPSCRLISSTIVKARSTDNLRVDALFASFGQFLDHDLSQTTTTIVKDKNGRRFDPQCCSSTHEVLKNSSKACLAIEIPEDDPYYSKSNRRCMSLIRSNTGKADHCRPGPRQQQNGISSYIDGSQIYGSRAELAKNLREFKGGRMKVCVDSNGREFPVHTDDNENGDERKCTDNVIRGQFNFFVGDRRAHIQPLLAVLHVIFIREHNRIAAELTNFHTNWDDETLFQETRRILTAILQRIVYNEFLPPLLGGSIMSSYDLELENCGFYDQYNSNENSGILNEFATAAFRFGHSLIQPIFRLIAENGDVRNEPLEGIFFKPLQLDKFDLYVKGFVNQSSQQMDNNMVQELTNKLFISPKIGDPGKDLAALNCQRGRDHGLGTYTDLRNHAGLPSVNSFEDLKYVMDSSVAEQFEQVYKNVEDIDLWLAGISEQPVPDGIVGPVFANIIGEQFKRLRKGDRFWFERNDTKWAFTEDQLREIRKASLARIFCDNSDVKEMQPLVLLLPTKLNKIVSCDSPAIPKMSFDPWKNERV